MRNPWPIFSVAAFAGAACLVYDHFFSYETMWIAVVAILALLILCFFVYCKYERWLDVFSHCPARCVTSCEKRR